MNDTRLQELLVDTLAAAEEREAALVALSDDTPSQVEGRWTAKDHLAHLASWRMHATRVLTAAHAGDSYPETDDIDAQNARTYAVNRDRSAAGILAEADTAYMDLVMALRACSDEELQHPRAGRPGPVWRTVPANGHQHVGQHLVQWHLEHGDRDAAEGIALWVRELDDRFDDDESRAVARYNLACFYAQTGVAARALPLLRESLVMRPSLREWARGDTDLDPVRGDPEVSHLLSPE